MLINIGSSWIQSFLHNTSFWKHAGRRCRRVTNRLVKIGDTLEFEATEKSQKLSYLAHSGWLETVSLIRLLVTSMMWTLSWWTWRQNSILVTVWTIPGVKYLIVHTTYHSSEQQSHEQGPCNKEEDDEDADDFIQWSLQPNYHLSAGDKNGEGSVLTQKWGSSRPTGIRYMKKPVFFPWQKAFLNVLFCQTGSEGWALYAPVDLCTHLLCVDFAT